VNVVCSINTNMLIAITCSADSN